jgi:hypothetical protein
MNTDCLQDGFVLLRKVMNQVQEGDWADQLRGQAVTQVPDRPPRGGRLAGTQGP